MLFCNANVEQSLGIRLGKSGKPRAFGHGSRNRHNPLIPLGQLDQFIAENGEEVLAGAGGITQFHIAALKEGVGTMTLQYKQDWEGGEVDGTYDLTLTVSLHHKKYLQIDSVKFVKVE